MDYYYFQFGKLGMKLTCHARVLVASNASDNWWECNFCLEAKCSTCSVIGI